MAYGSADDDPADVDLGQRGDSNRGDPSKGFKITGERFDLAGVSVSGTGDINGDRIDDMTAMRRAAPIGLFPCLAAIAVTPIIIGLVFGSPFKMSLRQGFVLTAQTYLLFFLSPLADEQSALTANMLAWTLVVWTCRCRKSG